MEDYYHWERKGEQDPPRMRDYISLPHPAYILRSPGMGVHFVNGMYKALSAPSYDDGDPEMSLHHDEKNLPPVHSEVFERARDIVIDLETTGLYWIEDIPLWVGIGYRNRIGEIETIILDGKAMMENEAMMEWIADFVDTYKEKIGGFNIKFDMLFLSQYYEVGLNSFSWDAMLEVNALNEYWFRDLKNLATYFCNAGSYEKELSRYVERKSDGYKDVPEDVLTRYLSRDLKYTLEVHEALRNWLGERHERFNQQFQIPVCRELAVMEFVGVAVDVDKLRELEEALIKEAESIKESIQRLSQDIISNPNSPKQVAAYLYDTLHAPACAIYGYGVRSTAEPVLEALPESFKNMPVIRKILEFRGISKILSSYVLNVYPRVYWDSLSRCHRVHPDWDQTAAITGRMSAHHPAVQTIPRAGEEGTWTSKIRACYTAAPDNVLCSVDGSQWELRVAAAESGDEFLLNAYANGKDIHGEVTSAMFGPGWNKEQRANTKRFVFSWIYGGSEQSSAAVFELPRDTIRIYVDRFNQSLHGLVEYRKRVHEEGKTRGYIETRLGRRCHFLLITSANEDAVRKGTLNYPIQGAASDLTCLALVDCAPKLRRIGARVVMLVHDSIVFEAPKSLAEKACKIVADSLERCSAKVYPELPWVAEAEVGPNWAESEKVKLCGDK
jgi:DNA polymerase-1